ncbi:uncharacterized protein LOC116338718 [Contarinia nasturtii]|uniref:uncharacterized protein LOC116338718 n=1 Tax=Contarinia nasturtii TaxID=265458 RepID=UPI0012D3F79B|nr:uncharacterized protein LOC116338718 [Contarinia nasturtii]
MKSFFFLSLLSFAISVQVIKGQEMTFATILNKLYTEGEGKVEIRSSFDCILRISNKVDVLKKKLESSLKEIIGSNTVENVENHIPEDLMISLANGNVNGRQKLLRVIDLVNVQQLMSVVRLTNVIIEKMSFQPDPKDLNAFCSFKRWYKRPIGVAHLKEIENSIITVTTQHGELRKRFDNEIFEMDQISAQMKKILVKLNACMGGELNVCQTVLKLKVEQAVNFIEQIYLKQDKLINRYQSTLKILDEYNVKRMEWTEFLVGIRKTLGGNRKLLQKDSSCNIM